ncbi:AbaSI family restriction endonuclease [Microbacterium sp. NPDC086615]|jgi:very-short-patch-repair endonuclease|uniref:AbaSI family restriction endonuclease n=1 Tax=Microbacterium sp. NPDC086615 TaxID=3154865 RepID=UPI00342308DE
MDAKPPRTPIDAELEWQALRLRKIVHKQYELWAITRIVHGLDDPEIEWVTQQAVPAREEGKRALLDLYFPQFRLAVEIDELQHVDQVEQDRLRERHVIDTANVEFWRWKMQDIHTLDDARDRIDKLIGTLRKRKRKQIKKGTFVPFRFGRTYDPAEWIERGGVGIQDDARFRRHVDVARLFGKDLAAHRSGMLRLTESVQVWFPKLYPNKEWDNALLDDGQRIVQRLAVDATAGSDPEPLPAGSGSGETRLVFAHYRDEFGRIYYRFVGAFEHIGQDGHSADFRRNGERITVDGAGGFEITRE